MWIKSFCPCGKLRALFLLDTISAVFRIETLWSYRNAWSQADKLVLLAIFVLADVSPTYSSGLPQGNDF